MLITLQDDLLRQSDVEETILLVLLDLSEAFDNIDHGILLDRLLGVGIGRLGLSWLQSFLDGCVQRVQLGEELSAP